MGKSVLRHPATGEELLTTTQAAAALAVSLSTLRRHLHDPAWGLRVYQRTAHGWHYVTRPSVEAARPRVWSEPPEAGTADAE